MQRGDAARLTALTPPHNPAHPQEQGAREGSNRTAKTVMGKFDDKAYLLAIIAT